MILLDANILNLQGLHWFKEGRIIFIFNSYLYLVYILSYIIYLQGLHFFKVGRMTEYSDSHWILEGHLLGESPLIGRSPNPH